jgi:hypothetical protein
MFMKVCVVCRRSQTWGLLSGRLQAVERWQYFSSHVRRHGLALLWPSEIGFKAVYGGMMDVALLV